MSDTEESDMKRVREHAEQLGEHFDTVQIFCTRHEAGQEDGTVSCAYGSGNWFARFGQVWEWLSKTDERTRSCVRKEENPS